MKLKKAIKKFCKDNKLKRQDIADRAGFTRQHLYKIQNNINKCKLDSVISLLGVIGGKIIVSDKGVEYD